MKWRSPLGVLLAISATVNLILAVTVLLRPAPSPVASPAPTSSSYRETPEISVVARTIDGDTVELEDGRRVRYLGVDAPETDANPNLGRAEPYGPEAAAFNRQLVERQVVWLLSDTTDRDDYGRLLRWVFLADGTFVQAELIRQGYAFVNIIPPDERFADLLRDLEARARAERRGIWATLLAVPTAGPAPSPTAAVRLPSPTSQARACSPELVTGAIGPEQAEAVVGQTATIVFQVVRTHNSGKAVFLNSHDPYQGYFYVVIFPERWSEFPEPPETYLLGRCVVITGRVQLYRGTPQIVLRDVSQLEVLW